MDGINGTTLLAGFAGFIFILFLIVWFATTKDLRDDVREWREEEAKRHKEIVDILKKDRPE